MFSSNQELKISGNLKDGCQLKEALMFVLQYSRCLEHFVRNEKPSTCGYYITEKGDFCVGHVWGKSSDFIPFQFGFDIDIIEAAIRKHLTTFDFSAVERDNDSYYDGDGMYDDGFLITIVDYRDTSDHLAGIFKVSPFTCYYAK